MRSTRFAPLALALTVRGPGRASVRPPPSKPRQAHAADHGRWLTPSIRAKSRTSCPRSSAAAAELDKALNTFGAPNPGQLSSGWISYSAILAAQNKEFVDAVRDIDSYYGRERVMTGMRNDVGYARTLKGGEAALQAALERSTARTPPASPSAGAFVKEQSYKLQNGRLGQDPRSKTRTARSRP